MHILKIPGAYFNEIDPGAAEWLRELIKAGLIAPGVVDERSILDVSADDLRGFVQCHFFAGIGGWSYALRLAGWPDDRPVWTGSPPCQPFSAAGRLEGRKDERHLAPHFVGLVGAARPGMLFGEQVASAAVFGKAASGPRRNLVEPPEWAWLDDLSDRLEAARYAIGASDFPSAGVGAPHIRQRTYFGAVAHEWLEHVSRHGRIEWRAEPSGRRSASGCGISGLADLHGDGRAEAGGGFTATGHDGAFGDGTAGRVGDGQRARLEGLGGDGDRGGEPGRIDQIPNRPAAATGAAGGVADPYDAAVRRHTRNTRTQASAGGPEARSQDGHAIAGSGVSRRLAEMRGIGRIRGRASEAGAEPGAQQRSDGLRPSGRQSRTRPLHNFWADADWLFCRDERWRPVEPAVLGLVDGLPGCVVPSGPFVPASYPLAQGGKDARRLMRLRGYGNAINPHAAATFIQSFMEAWLCR